MRNVAPHPPAFHKPDHPRPIDRYIDYFGNVLRARMDGCGELLLDAMAAEIGARIPATRAS